MAPRFFLGASLVLGQVLPACSGRVDSRANDNVTATTSTSAGGSSSAGTTTTATAEAAGPTTGDSVASTSSSTSSGGSSSAGTTGIVSEASSGASGAPDQLDCSSTCPPCEEGQRYHACATCTCEPIEDPVRDAHEELLGCRNWEAPCDATRLWVNPNAVIHNWYGSACLFTALRDRTPGRLDFSYQANAGFGITLIELVLLLDGTDRVLVLRTGYNGATYENQLVAFSPVESCVLKAPSEFEQCIADGDANTCDVWEDWFDKCLPVDDPSCPAE